MNITQKKVECKCHMEIWFILLIEEVTDTSKISKRHTRRGIEREEINIDNTM